MNIYTGQCQEACAREHPPSASPTIKHRWYKKDEGASYTIVQHPPPACEPRLLTLPAPAQARPCLQVHRTLVRMEYAQLQEMSVRRILPSTYSLVSPSMMLPLWLREDVRVYLIGYIFCIINDHICQNIFDMIDIMYCRLPYGSRCVLSLKTLVLYIYRSRGTIQYNQ
jgi:hypothetical protein